MQKVLEAYEQDVIDRDAVDKNLHARISELESERDLLKKQAGRHSEIRQMAERQEEFLRDIWQWLKRDYEPSLGGKELPECLRKMKNWALVLHPYYKTLLPSNNNKF